VRYFGFFGVYALVPGLYELFVVYCEQWVFDFLCRFG